MGHKRDNCLWGIAAIADGGHSRLSGRSKLYRTAPIDYLDQDWFVNCVIRIETRLDPYQLLSILKGLQEKAGRVKDTVRFGPRILDMDILFFDDAVIRHHDLILPHPRMHLRQFVLQPLCDIDPALHHPVLNRTVRYLLDHLEDRDQGVVELP